MAKLIVTAAPPTSNGDLHLGHISGPYLGADVFARVRRQLGDDVLCVSYSDDFQSYVQRKAFEETGEAGNLAERSQQVAQKFGKRMAESLGAAGIKYDLFMHSMESSNLIPALSSFYSAAEQSGLLVKRTVQAPFSSTHKVWGYEAFSRGTCPNCGASTDTSQCESCAFPPEIGNMNDLQCVLDGTPMDKEMVEQTFLRVGAKRKFLREQFSKKNPRDPLRSFFEKILESDLIDWAITRPGDWGPELPSHPGESLHTWFAGISGYLAASMDWARNSGDADGWKHYWNDADTDIVHFVGIDCAFSHAVVYPILLSCRADSPAVRQLYTNQFLTLNGLGFSTSRGLAIWAGEFFEVIDQDAVRYYLALKSPELSEADFNLRDFEETTNLLFGGTLWKALEKIANSSSGSTEISDGLCQDTSLIKLANIRADFLQASDIDNFSMSNIANCLQGLIVLIHLSNPQSLGQLLGLYAKLSQCLQPGLSRSLASALKLPDGWGDAWLLEGHPVEPLEVSDQVRSELRSIRIPSVDSGKIKEFEAFVSELADRHTARELVPAE